MSLLTTASPYHSREDGSGEKVGKKQNNRRKATMPSLSTSISDVKKYMTQLIQSKEPQPSLSSYNGTPINEFYSYKPSGSSDMLYPILEENSSSSKNISNDMATEAIEDSPNIEDLLKKSGALPTPEEIPSFYKQNKSQQSGITSALQKLTGSKTITQEGMSDYKGAMDATSMADSSSDKGSASQTSTYEPPYIPTMPAFTMNQRINGNEQSYSPSSPIDYLTSSASSPTLFSDYSSSYSSSNYVVPPNLSRYSYPTMRPSVNASQMEQIFSDSGSSQIETDHTQQILLEKINYMIYLLEQQKREKNKHTTEEFVLYSFLGVFVIYLADSFARSGRYIR